MVNSMDRVPAPSVNSFPEGHRDGGRGRLFGGKETAAGAEEPVHDARGGGGGRVREAAAVLVKDA